MSLKKDAKYNRIVKAIYKLVDSEVNDIEPKKDKYKNFYDSFGRELDEMIENSKTVLESYNEDSLKLSMLQKESYLKGLLWVKAAWEQVTDWELKD